MCPRRPWLLPRPIPPLSDVQRINVSSQRPDRWSARVRLAVAESRSASMLAYVLSHI